MSAFPKIEISEEDYRELPALRDALGGFLASDAGMWMLHLLREKNLPKRPEAALPADKLEQLDAAARRESIGWENCIRHMRLLSKPIRTNGEKPKAPRLGEHDDHIENDPYLPPERPVTPRSHA